MKRVLVALIAISIGWRSLAESLAWTTDVAGAKAQAKRENKCVMLDFTGSDWCGWCKKLKAEVFDQPEFAVFAKTNLIAVEVDFPKYKAQSKEQRSANEHLAQDYNIIGFPTVVLLAPNGDMIGQAGYTPGGPKAFIDRLKGMPGFDRSKLLAGGTNGTVLKLSDIPEGKPRQEKAASTAPSTQRDPSLTLSTLNAQLALKGISGLPNRRLALINNQSLMAGEKGSVKILNQRVEVLCKEVKDGSAIISVAGITMELKLTGQ